MNMADSNARWQWKPPKRRKPGDNNVKRDKGHAKKSHRSLVAWTPCQPSPSPLFNLPHFVSVSNVSTSVFPGTVPQSYSEHRQACPSHRNPMQKEKQTRGRQRMGGTSAKAQEQHTAPSLSNQPTGGKAHRHPQQERGISEHFALTSPQSPTRATESSAGLGLPTLLALQAEPRSEPHSMFTQTQEARFGCFCFHSHYEEGTGNSGLIGPSTQVSPLRWPLTPTFPH
jgi:hypothetical protein